MTQRRIETTMEPAEYEAICLLGGMCANRTHGMDHLAKAAREIGPTLLCFEREQVDDEAIARVRTRAEWMRFAEIDGGQGLEPASWRISEDFYAAVLFAAHVARMWLAPGPVPATALADVPGYERQRAGVDALATALDEVLAKPEAFLARYEAARGLEAITAAAQRANVLAYHYSVRERPAR